jgi:hypothetical protein
VRAPHVSRRELDRHHPIGNGSRPNGQEVTCVFS